MNNDDKKKYMPKATISRLPVYRMYLKNKRSEGATYVSSATIASDLDLTSVQVRKDLAWVSSAPGKPKIGFVVDNLIADIEEYFGYSYQKNAVLIGVGHLGKALLSYNRFEKYGLNIMAAFEHNESKINTVFAEKNIYSLADISDFIEKNDVSIGIITVPKASAQEVCDILVKSGIKAIWNFAPVMLEVPKHVAVRNEDMAASLAKLSIQMLSMNDR
ncbi:MAG: redox-sensing transcriptional repressor Rex [Clostridia bacterium]|nr:redox-sensing transcriptional repressor Rex [Clostridia bacterium]